MWEMYRPGRGIQSGSTFGLSAHELQGENSLYVKSHEDIIE